MKFACKMSVCALGLVSLFTVSAWAADASAGQAVFSAKCKTCHAADGSGNANLAKAMKVEIKPLGSAEVQSKSDADLKKIISEGQGKMKPVAVSGADLDNVVAFVRSLKK
jgi:mono/diheme cytochrome c family protein